MIEIVILIINILIVICCFICQFIGAKVQSEVSEAEAILLQSEIQSELTDRERQLLLASMGYNPQALQDQIQGGPSLKICERCGKTFRPVADESMISKCPQCGKGYIL